ncbi:heat shock factor protein 5 isoform X2 [Cheilinus undulatus]|uniref:heat shock factor protein 5 isoform X2 n=1 Tax=Cheilinus undulatus TaxID=241271 RepID=UPI001BD6CE96|nr:heat shock factor protein 5 isoform X2 [Cheilinus undulatus]
MDAGNCPLPDSINPNNFPAKLWRLVNSPAKPAIRWDSQGEGILIDKELFEKQILSPSTFPIENPDAFKTTNFSSFIRQLNLYGFRKTEPFDEEEKSGKYQHFYNPIFKRNHPELIVGLRRLTAENKAKIEAGENVSCRPPSKYARVSSGNVKRETSLLHTPTHQKLTHPYYPKQVQPGIAHNRTPVPPRYLMRGQGAALSPSVFAPDKGIPASFSHHYAGEATGSSAMHSPQGLLAHANHRNVPYQPRYFSACHYYSMNLGASQMASSGLHAGPFSPYKYYQGSCPANMFCAGDNNLNLQNMQNHEMNKNEVNLDRIFQIADEVMQTTPDRLLIKVKTPEKPSPVSMPPPSAIPISFSKEPISDGQIIKAVSSMANPAKMEPQEEFGISIPVQLPEDAISEVCACLFDWHVAREASFGK